jgi:AmmeMemoRadiSam system protein B
MSGIRLPAVAGTFYPAESLALRSSVRRYLRDARPGASRVPKALIAPHAGHVYSGPIAASAYAALEPVRDRIERVVLLGPSHRVFVRGLAVPASDWFRTPLGPVAVDRQAIDAILDLPQVIVSDEAHAFEHSLEVHLPFLQEVLGDFSLVPLVVGDARPQEVAGVLDRLWGGEETLIVVSSDLSHYHDYETARRMDAATSRAIEALEPAAIDPEHACGCVPVQGLLVAAREHGLRVTAIDLRNSGDTAGPRERVVGYGAYVVA